MLKSIKTQTGIALLCAIITLCLALGMLSITRTVASAENVILDYSELHLTWEGFASPTEGGDPYRVDSPETATSLISGLGNAYIPYSGSLEWYTHDGVMYHEYGGLSTTNYLPFDGGTIYYLYLQICPASGYEFKETDFSLRAENITFNGIQATELYVDSRQIVVFFPMPITAGTPTVQEEGYHAKIHDIQIPEAQPGYGDTDLLRHVFITNTGTEELAAVSLTWKTPTEYFRLGYNAAVHYIAPGVTKSEYYVYPESGLPSGTYSATLVLSATNLEDVVEATVSFSVAYDHEHITELHSSLFGHWYECTVSGCNYQSSVEEHNDDVTKNQVSADFANNGYTGDKHCSVCDYKVHKGQETAALKYIRSSSGSMAPSNISSALRPNDLVFTSSEPSKYQIALSSVYDLTDTTLNINLGRYPLDSYFVEDHLYRIYVEFSAVGDYEYDEQYFPSSFVINGAPVDMAAYTSLSGSTSRQLLQTATGIPLIFTDSEAFNIPEGNGNEAIAPYSIASAASGGSEPYTFRKYGGADWISVSEDGIVSGTRTNSDLVAGTLVIEVTDAKGAQQYISISVGTVNHVHIAEGAWKDDEAQHYKECACGEKVNATAHDYDAGTETTPASHLYAGVMTYECQVCGHQKTETIPAKVDEHTFSTTWSYNDDIHWHASSCGHSVRQDEAAHSWDDGIITTEPTHTTFGVRTRYCICGASKAEQVAKTAVHEYGTWQQHNESQHKRTCPCGEIEYQVHNWNGGVTTTAPTHTTFGVKTYTCTEITCGATKTVQVAKTESHEYGTWQQHNESQHKRACACGDIEYQAHDWNQWQETLAPTEHTTGTKERTCKVCSYKETASIPVLTHTHSWAMEYSTSEGYHWYACSGCGDKKDESAHLWGAGVVTTEPTHITFGVKTYTCVCGVTKTEQVATTTDHEYGAWQQDDESQHKRTCACGDIDYQPHAWGTGVVTTEPTHTTKGVRTFTCECGMVKTEDVPMLIEHTYGDWQSNANTHWKECACGDEAQKDMHAFSWITDIEPQIGIEGKMHEECSICHYTRNDNTPIDPLTHIVVTEGDKAVVTISGNLETGVDIKSILESLSSMDVEIKVSDKGAITFNAQAVAQLIAGDVVLSVKEGSIADHEGAELVLEINLNSAGITFTGEGKAVISYAFTEAVPSGKLAKVYYIDGANKVDMNATISNGMVTFETNHFSTYVVELVDKQPETPITPAPVDDAQPEPPKDTLSGGAIAGIVIGSVVVVALGGFAVFWFVIKKKKLLDLVAVFKK